MKNVKVIYSSESKLAQNILKMLDARWQQVQSVHHVVLINIRTIDIALTTKRAHKRICLLPYTHKDASNNNLLISAVVGDFVQVVIFSISKKTRKTLIEQIKQMDGEEIEVNYLKKFQKMRTFSPIIYIYSGRNKTLF